MTHQQTQAKDSSRAVASTEVDRRNKPSICIVSHNGYGLISGGKSGFIGGVEWQTSLLARWLADHGYRVSMVTWDEGGPAEETFSGVKVIKVCRQNAGLPMVRFFHPKWTSLNGALARADADLYYQNSAECVTGQIALWCRGNGKPFVYSLASDADCNPALPELPKSLERKLYVHGLRSATRRICQTHKQRAQLEQHFGVDATVIPMACPDYGSATGISEYGSRNNILWVGRVCEVKRPDRLLDLAEKLPNEKFDMVGPYVVPEDEVATKKRAAGIANVKLHGATPREKLAPLYQNAFVLCCTSNYEGFPNTFLEAWSYGVPVVSTVDPDSVITRYKMGIVANNVSEFAAAIQMLRNSPAKYAEMAENGRRYYVENHKSEAVFPRYEEVFHLAVAAGAVHS